LQTRLTKLGLRLLKRESGSPTLLEQTNYLKTCVFPIGGARLKSTPHSPIHLCSRERVVSILPCSFASPSDAMNQGSMLNTLIPASFTNTILLPYSAGEVPRIHTIGNTNEPRKKRAHTKSRRGCIACKVRKVKVRIATFALYHISLKI
jgi:hypothetical protein